MATNKYFNNTQRPKEQNLFERLVIEHIQMNGVDITYIPRENVNIDEILLEPTQSIFDKYYTIEAYMPDTGNFDGEQDIMGKFGYQISQQTEFQISKKRWNELGTGFVRPREGDLIYVADISSPGSSRGSFTNTLFQINQVWYNNPDWQFGKHFVFRMHCKTFVNSHEKFKTGNTEIDQMNQESSEDILKGLNEATKRFQEKVVVKKDRIFGES